MLSQCETDGGTDPPSKKDWLLFVNYMGIKYKQQNMLYGSECKDRVRRRQYSALYVDQFSFVVEDGMAFEFFYWKQL